MGILLKKFSLLNSTAEQIIVKLEISSIKKLYATQKYLNSNANLDPASWQIKPDFLIASKLNYITNSTNLLVGTWGYNFKQKSLIYHIKEPIYFKSSDGLPFITLRLIKLGKTETIKVSNFKWCKIKSWQGCNQW